MNILKLDTSISSQVSIELVCGQEVFRLVRKNKPGSQVLLDLITKILSQAKLKPGQLDSIEVSTGPGSFTGLRVGVSVAQALGYALGIKVNGQINKPLEIRYT